MTRAPECARSARCEQDRAGGSAQDAVGHPADDRRHHAAVARDRHAQEIGAEPALHVENGFDHRPVGRMDFQRGARREGQVEIGRPGPLPPTCST